MLASICISIIARIRSGVVATIPTPEQLTQDIAQTACVASSACGIGGIGATSTSSAEELIKETVGTSLGALTLTTAAQTAEKLV